MIVHLTLLRNPHVAFKTPISSSDKKANTRNNKGRLPFSLFIRAETDESDSNKLDNQRVYDIPTDTHITVSCKRWSAVFVE